RPCKTIRSEEAVGTQRTLEAVGAIGEKALNEDIAETLRYLERIHNGITSGMLQIPETIKVNKIGPHELTDPLVRKKTDFRGKRKPYIIKKLLNQITDVGCIPTNIIQLEKIQTKLSALEEFRESPNILKFYGLSYIDNQQVKVYEWANRKLTRREVYNTYNISWVAKVSIALDICWKSLLAFLLRASSQHSL
ncbi:6751_t:CDS:2, partial [Funneliformis mosseae]